MSHHTCKENTSKASHRHSILQAQVHHAAGSQACRHHHQGISRSQASITRFEESRRCKANANTWTNSRATQSRQQNANRTRVGASTSKGAKHNAATYLMSTAATSKGAVRRGREFAARPEDCRVATEADCTVATKGYCTASLYHTPAKVCCPTRGFYCSPHESSKSRLISQTSQYTSGISHQSCSSQ